jgi:PKD repeat protein
VSRLLQPHRFSTLAATLVLAALATRTTAADFNGDAKPDIVWRHEATGQNYLWYMDGAARLGIAALPPLPDANWQIAGAADFNGDGKSDLLWRNRANGQNYVWYLDGTAQLAAVPATPLTDINWLIAGVADFNADGKPDIVWRHGTSGQNYLWHMNGVLQSAVFALPTLPDTAWHIAGLADFNGDTKPDIVWRNQATGQNYVWYMDGVTNIGGGWCPGLTITDWQIVGVADFNADGKADLLWRHKISGDNYLWYMDGISQIGGAPVVALPDADWSVVPAATYNQAPISNPGGPYVGVAGIPIVFSGAASQDPDGTIASYAWTFGDNSAGSGVSVAHTYAQPGTYNVQLTVTDNRSASSAAQITVQVFGAPVLENVAWTGVVNATASGNTLTKPATGHSRWDAGASSTRAIVTGEGYVEFTAPADTSVAVGLSHGDTNQTRQDIDYGVALSPTTGCWLIDGSSGGPCTYVPGDRFRIELVIDNGNRRVVYLRNGNPLAETHLVSAYPLLVDVAIETPGSLAAVTLYGSLVDSAAPEFVAPKLVWQNGLTGDLRAWFLDGAAKAGESALMPASMLPTDWKIAGTGDFNGDGKIDLLWQNITTGDVAYWTMHGVTQIDSVGLPPAETGWRAKAAGDFNGDGRPDIVWRNLTNGENRVSFVVDGSVIGTAPIQPLGDTTWDIVGAGDFDRDGQCDVLWRHGPTGSNYVWYMDDTTYRGGSYLPAEASADWKIAGTGDFNEDGSVDILWWNSATGAVMRWLMDNVTRISVSALPAMADTNWRAAGYLPKDTRPPVANIGGPYDGWRAETITFNAGGSSDPDGTIRHYRWFFGDGTSAKGATVSHTYTAGATYTVRLTVTDNRGATATTTTAVLVRQNRRPQVTLSGTSSCHVPCTATFTGAASDPENDPLTWTWGGCAAGQTGATVTCTLTSVGTGVVTLTVSDGVNAPVVKETTLYGTNSAPAVQSLTLDGTGYCAVPCTATFRAVATDADGDLVALAWSGCAEGQIGPVATCRHETPGPLTATLAALDGRGGRANGTGTSWGTAAGSNIPPEARGGGPYKGVVGRKVYFDGRRSRDLDGQIVTYLWAYNDGTVDTGPTLTTTSHTYATVGTYTATLRATDNQGGVTDDNFTVTIVADVDPDNDGLTTAEEQVLGSNPLLADTNGDGISDLLAKQLNLSLTSLDTDGDGILNVAELAAGSDPIKTDTDGDSVADGADVFALDPTQSSLPPPDPSDVTPPAIFLERPVGAVEVQ